MRCEYKARCCSIWDPPAGGKGQDDIPMIVLRIQYCWLGFGYACGTPSSTDSSPEPWGSLQVESEVIWPLR